MMQIDVPESITREAVGLVLQQLGIDYSLLKSFTIHPGAIEAEVFAVDEHGSRFTHDGLSAARHTILIPIVDPPA